jgi:hypothetical protein
MSEWQMPAVVVPESCQAHKGFVPFTDRKRAWPFELALVLLTRRSIRRDIEAGEALETQRRGRATLRRATFSIVPS